VADENGKPAVNLGCNANGGYLGVANTRSEIVVSAQADEKGAGKIGAWDGKGKGRVLVPDS